MSYFWILYILLIKIVSGLRGDPYLFANESIGSPMISTTSGKFLGLTIRETNVWIGIPYAAPPIGELRWQKAQPYVVTNSQVNTIQNATNYGPSCLQINRGGLVPGPFDEDCLYLNIWAPREPSLSPMGYPVMLWIHGGGFVEGSGSQVIYDGLSWTNAAIRENNSFIMVSINYRLNLMGFFVQSVLFDENNNTIANQGITDQRMAMKWIRDNIEQFGGNKNSITLLGQSAGAHSVCIHLVSPLSKDLFHGAIMDSGSCDTSNYLRDKSFAFSVATNLASIVGCNMSDVVQKLTCLRAVNSTLLMDAIANVSFPMSTSLAFKDQEKVVNTNPFLLIVDEVEIPIHPLQAFLLGKYNQVPLIVGANRDELLLRLLYEEYYHPPTSAEDYLTRILPIVTYNNSDIAALYTPSQFDGNYTQAFVALLSQVTFICSSRRLAGYMSGHMTYLYSYNHAPEFYWLTTPNIVIWPGAYHMAELFSLFQTLAAVLYGNDIFEPDELPLATSVRQYWTNMITTGQPNDNTSLAWPQYISNNDQILLLNKNMTISTFIQMYPNCDLISNMQVSVFGQYLGFNATCMVGNKCFIINSSTIATTTSIGYKLCNSQLNLFILLFMLIFFIINY